MLKSIAVPPRSQMMKRRGAAVVHEFVVGDKEA